MIQRCWHLARSCLFLRWSISLDLRLNASTGTLVSAFRARTWVDELLLTSIPSFFLRDFFLDVADLITCHISHTLVRVIWRVGWWNLPFPKLRPQSQISAALDPRIEGFSSMRGVFKAGQRADLECQLHLRRLFGSFFRPVLKRGIKAERIGMGQWIVRWCDVWSI